MPGNGRYHQTQRLGHSQRGQLDWPTLARWAMVRVGGPVVAGTAHSGAQTSVQSHGFPDSTKYASRSRALSRLRRCSPTSSF